MYNLNRKTLILTIVISLTIGFGSGFWIQNSQGQASVGGILGD